MSSKTPFTYKGKPYSFKVVARNFARAKRRLPKLMGDEVVRFSRTRFQAQAWTDKSAKKWEPRKNPKKGRGRSILVKSGRLRNSVRILQADFNQIVVGSSLPYAQAHNDGFKGTVQVSAHKRDTTAKTKVYDTRSMNIKTRKHKSKTVRVRTGSTTVKSHSRKVNLPQRQFLGHSSLLNAKLDRVIVKEIDKIFQL